MATPNTGIPYVPEGTQDPAAGLNLALNTIDVLLQTTVIDMDLTAPPGSPNDGDLHIVAASATGAWDGQDNNLSRYVAEGDFWQFFEAGADVHLIINKDDGALYVWDGAAWTAPIVGGSVSAAAVSFNNTASGLAATDVQAAIDELAQASGGIADAPSDGKLYGRKDAAWEEVPGGGGSETLSIITEASSFTAGPATHAGLSRYIRAGGDVTFDSVEGYGAGQVFNIRATASLSLVGSGVTLTPTTGGTLALDAGMAVTVVMVTATTADVIGLTVAA